MIDLSQRKHGIGAPLLVFHGFLGDETAWDEAVEGLPNPVFAVRLPGHGHAPRTMHAAAFGDVVRVVADNLSLDVPCVLAGYSMGGRVAVALAGALGPKVLGLLAIGAHPGLLTAEAARARRDADEVWAARFEREPLPDVVGDWARQPIFATQAALPRDVLDRQHRSRLSHEPRGLAWAMRTLGLGAMPAQQRAYGACPTICMAGELDAAHAEHARTLALRSSAIEARVVPSVGHNLLLEAPRAVRDALRSLCLPPVEPLHPRHP